MSSYIRIKPRRSTTEEWKYTNPILAEGEMAVEYPSSGIGTGPVKIKFGDGYTPWNELPYGLEEIRTPETPVQTVIKINEEDINNIINSLE